MIYVQVVKKTQVDRSPYSRLNYMWRGEIVTRNELEKRLEQSPFSAVSDVVYEYLFHEIITLNIEPGSLLNESKLAKLLGLSRTPIRSALDRLEAEELIRQPKGKGAQVSPLNTGEYYNLCDMRAAIEGHASYLAAKLITATELGQLKTLLVDMSSEEKQKRTISVAEDTKFHEIIIDSSRNDYLRKGYDLYKAKLLRYRWYIHLNCTYDQRSMLGRQNVHLALYNALKLKLSSQAREEALGDVALMQNALRSIFS